MSTAHTPCTPGQTVFYQGENHTHALFRIEPGIPCQHACEQASELMGYARDLTLEGLMEDKPKLIWVAPTTSAHSAKPCWTTLNWA